MVKFYVKDLTLMSEIPHGTIKTDYIPLEYSGDDPTLKLMKNWTVAFNIPLTDATVSGIELVRSFVKEVIVTCTEESMIDHTYAAYLASKGVSIITPYGPDFRQNVELLREVVGFGADLVVDSQFRYAGFALSLSQQEFLQSTYGIIEVEQNIRPAFINDYAKLPSMHLTSLAPMDSDSKEWRSSLLESIAYFIYWHKQKWEAKAYRWDSYQDTWI